MTTLLIDPTLRRAKIVRAAVAALCVVTVAALAICARELRARDHAAPSLPTPRRPGKTISRRPVCGQKTARQARQARRLPTRVAVRARSTTAPRRLDVTAFIEPTVRGALDSLARHAAQIDTAAFTGLLLGDGGSVVDRIDERALAVARAARVRAAVLLQNLDARDGSWRPERVRRLAGDAAARARLAAQLVEICARRRLSAVHLDLEDLDDDWTPLAHIIAAIAAPLRRAGVEVVVDVPAALDDRVLAAVVAAADRVVVMAYDEHDADGPAGPIASDAYVETALAAAKTRAGAKLIAGLPIYGYDWTGAESADPISFADAHAAAKEARVAPRWDAAGNVRFSYSDDEGHHEIWLTDGASLYDEVGIAAGLDIGSVALWRLGGEDPGVWDALARRLPAAEVAHEARVDNVGDGPFLALALAPEAGQRVLRRDGARIVDERWTISPSSYLVRRAGVVPGEVALTFDDGPDERFTPAILDILEREHVPATFFVIGVKAAERPSLVRRAFAAGHEIGNHTFLHPNVDEVSTARLRTELESTSQLLESLLGRRPLLYRPPSLADIEPRSPAGAAAFARAGALGYLVVDADVDPRDWERPSPDALVAATLEEVDRGGVILLHDGGGDRSHTVAALPAIIAGLRARGMRFVPLSQLVGKTRDDVMPRPPRAGLLHLVAGRLVGLVIGGLRVGRVTLVVALVLVALRSLGVLALALAGERRRRRRRRRGPLPSATAIVPAFNERLVIERTIDSVLASDVPIDVLVVDDGSTDGTADLVERRYRDEPRLRLLRQANAGKAAALRAATALCRSEVIVALDGDTLFAPATVRRLLEPFTDPRVAAVAGTAEVGNVENALGRWQALEYLVQQHLERRAWDLFGAVPIVPGAVGAWRRRAVLAAGGFSSETLAEDADLAMALCRRGWQVVYAPSARARTEAPATVRALLKQRARWSFGILQALFKHRGAVVTPTSGAFGRVVWPAMLLFQIALPLLTPAALLSLVVAALARNLTPALVAGAVLLGAELLQLAAAALLAREPRAWRLVPALLSSRICYRPLLLGVSLRSVARFFDGAPLAWGKLARRNTVLAYRALTSGLRVRAQ